MNVPFERARALVQTKQFLEAMLDPKQTPRTPRRMRGQAKALVKHYPGLFEIEMAHKALPSEFNPLPPFSRMYEETESTELQLDNIGTKND